MSSEPSRMPGPFGPMAKRPALWRRGGRFVKFALVGGSGVGVNLAVFHVSYMLLQGPLEQGMAHTGANLMGVMVSILTNFLINDSWTWGDRAKGSWWGRLARYYLVCGAAATIQLLVAKGTFDLWLAELAWVVGGINLSPHLAVLIGILAGIAINFPVSHFWTFRAATKP